MREELTKTKPVWIVSFVANLHPMVYLTYRRHNPSSVIIIIITGLNYISSQVVGNFYRKIVAFADEIVLTTATRVVRYGSINMVYYHMDLCIGINRTTWRRVLFNLRTMKRPATWLLNDENRFKLMQEETFDITNKHSEYSRNNLNHSHYLLTNQ